MVPREAKIRSQMPPDDFKNRSPSSMASRLRLGGLRNASWASLGRPGGRRKGAESPLGRPSNTLPIHFLMPRWFWRGFGTSMRSLLEVFLKAFWRKTICTKTNSRNIKSCRNTCVFTIGLHVDVAADAFRDKETSSNCRCG